MQISDDLVCLYSARVTEQGDTYTVEVPKREVQRGNVQAGESYRVALISSTADESTSESTPYNEESVSTTHTQSETGAEHNSRSRGYDAQPDPPISEGELRKVETENLIDKGD